MVQILQGCALTCLSRLAAESVDCVVTSPPYWGLRDYGVPPTAWPACAYAPMPGLPALAVAAETSCLGLEPTLHAFIGHLVLIFEEVRRVLKPQGTCWVNMGDGFAGSWGSQGREYSGLPVSQLSARQVAAAARKNARPGSLQQYPGLKPKDLQGQPWRLAFALQAAGWWLRSEIIWHKPNPMPESITDRATKAHEQLFMLTKSADYFFDQEAWKEKAVTDPARPGNQWDRHTVLIPGQRPQKRASRASRDPGNINPPKGQVAYENGDERHRTKAGLLAYAERNRDGVPTRNKRSVWTVPTTPYHEAHYATFPPELIRPCIRAGCPATGTVLDPFGGSGTTAQVAIEEGRQAILIELGAQNLPLIEQRLAKITPGLPGLAP